MHITYCGFYVFFFRVCFLKWIADLGDLHGRVEVGDLCSLDVAVWGGGHVGTREITCRPGERAMPEELNTLAFLHVLVLVWQSLPRFQRVTTHPCQQHLYAWWLGVEVDDGGALAMWKFAHIGRMAGGLVLVFFFGRAGALGFQC